MTEPGEEGHIVVNVADGHPIGLMEQYWKANIAEASVFRDGWYYTGDRAYKDKDAYFYFVGRGDDVFKSSGYRIGPF